MKQELQMETFKICSICNKNLPTYKFTKYSLCCYECKQKEYRKRYRTKELLPQKIYSSQKSSSKKRGHKQPSYTLEQLKEWLYSQELFHSLYNNWEESNYDINLQPSIDRINDEIGYQFDNIQLMTVIENRNKGILDHKKRLLNGITYIHTSLYHKK